MTTETPNFIRMEVNFPDFERRIEEEFKPALRAAIEEVTCAFVAEIGGAVIVKEAAPAPANPVAFLDGLSGQHRRLEERMKLANERLEERLREIAA